MFFAVVLAKKYLNPSSDIIEVLAGLDNVDAVFNSLVDTLDVVMKDGRTGMRFSRAIVAQHLLTLSSRSPTKGSSNCDRRRFRGLSDGTRLILPAPRLLSRADEGTREIWLDASTVMLNSQS